MSVAQRFVRLMIVGTVLGIAGPALAVTSVELFDANVRYTSGIFVPLSAYNAFTIQPLTTAAWTSSARPISRVAADGASLILVRVALPITSLGPVHATLVSGELDSSPGSLWGINDQHLVESSLIGGAVDTPHKVRRMLWVPTFVVGGQRFAFLLYRSPRNFDSSSGSTSELANRTAWLTVQLAGSSSAVTQAITIVRPLVIFIHGTGSDNDAWAQFPLWEDSANELNDFQPGTLPFQATRISFHWIWNSTGGVQENADTILPQLVSALRYWREATDTAATQAEVVTHSFGGFIARQVAQTQPDPDPLTPNDLHNFRAATNWGHGSIHKLVTLAATHRGSGDANGVAFLNANGRTSGFVREEACTEGEYIDMGALRDQMVLSPALQSLRETPVPGHVIVGSGRAALDPSNTYNKEAFGILLVDKSDGPYVMASGFNNSACPTDSLFNYIFNLDPDIPPITGSGTNNDCSVTPNYDLVVSAYSSQGLMPASATTTALDLDPAAGLIGRLNHSALHDPAFGSAQIVATISDRVAFLLKQGTKSQYFSHFPAADSVAQTPLEERFSQEFDSSWLEVGTNCPAPSYDSTCPAYSSVQVVPPRLLLEDATPTPLYVYGLLNGEWRLAHSPTSSSSTSRNCAVTLDSSSSNVVDFMTNAVTGAQTVVATGAGTATIEVSVQGVAGTVSVPVTVVGIGN